VGHDAIREEMIMKRWTFLMAAFLLGALPSAAGGQAAVGYGMAASKSTAVATKMRPLTDSRGKQLATKIQDRAGTAKPLPITMEENRKKLEEKGAQSGGSIHVESVPEKAAVAVDGEPVAYTPADLKLPEGKHVIELTRPGYLPWETEISVNKIESTALKAELEEKYKSSITLPKF
jgi:hypothetical protein